MKKETSYEISLARSGSTNAGPIFLSCHRHTQPLLSPCIESCTVQHLKHN